MPDPIHGQSLCFKFLTKKVLFNSKQIIVINTAQKNSKILNTLFCLIKISICLFKTKKIKFVYLSGSRTYFGIIKELPVYFFKPFKQYKLIFHSHGYELSSYFGLKKIFFKKLFSVFDLIIVLNNAMKNAFKEIKTKFVVVENFYHPDFDNLVNLSSKTNTIVYYSNIIKSKGIFEFLEFADMFLIENKDWNIKIAGSFLGDNYLSKKIISKIFYSRYNSLRNIHGKRIEFFGVLKGQERVNLLEKSKFYILPTYYKTEAIPLSIIEAMRTGNIIITTKHNILPTFLNEKNGILIDPKSVNQIGASIKKLLKNEIKMKSIMSYNINYAVNNYSPKNHTSKLEKIFRQM